MELGEPDASGRRRPVEIPGSEFVMDVDTVIMSLGTSPNPLISSTTIRTGYQQEKMYHCRRSKPERHPKMVYTQVEMPLPEQLPLSWLWVQVKQAAKGIHEFLSNK